MSFMMETALKFVFGEDKFQKNNTIFHHIAESDCDEILNRIWENTKEKELQHILQLKNDDGKTCLHTAAKNMRGLRAEWIIAQMIDMGADLDAQENATGNTVLHIAVKQKDYVLVEYLLSENTKKNIKNNDELTPYQLAKQEKDHKMMELFSSKMLDN